MSERKVLNKYYPPDFDPSKIPRLKQKSKQHKVRTMAPCNMRCNTCGDYIAKARKFNARKETVEDETYIGLLVYRFYIKCPKCMAEITFKTDPKETDYVVEQGATQNFMALKMAERQAVEEAAAEEEEEKINPMKHLENRTNASKNEMEASEQIQNLRMINQRQISTNFDSLIADKKNERLVEMEKQEEEDRMLAKSILAYREATTSVETHRHSREEILEPQLGALPALSDRTCEQKETSSILKSRSKRLKLAGIMQPKVLKDPSLESTQPTTSADCNPGISTSNAGTIKIRSLCAYSDSESECD